MFACLYVYVYVGMCMYNVCTYNSCMRVYERVACECMSVCLNFMYFVRMHMYVCMYVSV